MASSMARSPIIDPRVANAALVVLIALAVANFTFGVVLDGYRPSETINTAFLALIAGIVALRGSGDDGKDGDP
jgi:cation transporter-like permease